MKRSNSRLNLLLTCIHFPPNKSTSPRKMKCSTSSINTELAEFTNDTTKYNINSFQNLDTQYLVVWQIFVCKWMMPNLPWFSQWIDENCLWFVGWWLLDGWMIGWLAWEKGSISFMHNAPRSLHSLTHHHNNKNPNESKILFGVTSFLYQTLATATPTAVLTILTHIQDAQQNPIISSSAKTNRWGN